MKKLFFVLLYLSVALTNAQNKKYYNFAVNNCNEITSEGLIENCIKESYVLNYDFKTINDQLISTDKIKKPIVLLAAASWSAPCWGEVPALNKMVEKYDDKVAFVMIISDKKAKAQRMAAKLDKRIKLVPARDLDKIDKNYLDISGFVHKLDYPSAYLIDKNKKIINVKRGALTPTKKLKWDEVTTTNIANFETFLAPVLN